MRFSPTGTIKEVRQVTARFSQPMVPLGDPRVSVSPFAIDCPQKGAARWIDSFNWSFDFKQDLPAGVQCTFTLRSGLKTLAGQPVASAPPFQFDTGGPSVIETRPWMDSNAIDEQQAFVLMLDTTVDQSTIPSHASFSVSGIAENIGVTVMSGANYNLLAKRFQNAIAKRPFVILQARQTFPAEATVKLVWGKGIKSTSGIATSDDQELNYTVRKAFNAKVRCERENAKAGCIPLTPITVHFTDNITTDLARKIALVAPDGARIAPKISDDNTNETSDVDFEPPFKESTAYKVVLPPNLTDESGRKLIDASKFPYEVTTDQFPPLAKFSSRFGIIESVDPALPITVRNLEAQIHGSQLKVADPENSTGTLGNLITRVEATIWRVPGPDPREILDWLGRVAAAKRSKSVFEDENAGETSFDIPKPNGPKAFEVMGIPLKRRGLYVVELKSEHLGAALLDPPRAMYVPAAALVTNLAVHFKQGKANSLVWVTELENAKPVEGARVKIADCHGAEIWSGRTDYRGLALVPQLDALDNPPTCDQSNSDNGSEFYSDQNLALQNLTSGVLVVAQYGADYSFVHSSWKNGIESWRFHLPSFYQSSPFNAHTVFDRTLLRAGETVHMKHFIRAQTLDGFALPPPDKMPDTVSIRFAGGDQHYDLDLTWSEDGTAATDWAIPKDAKLGEYQVVLARTKSASPTASPNPNADTSSTELQSGSFQVQEFRIPLMKAAIKVPATPEVSVTQVPIDVSANYLSGGAARGLPVILRSQVSNTNLASFADFQDFTFANGAVKEGIKKTDTSMEGPPEAQPGVHQRKDLTLDAAGGARTVITDIPPASVPQDVRAELEFRDPNGETQTVSNTVTIWPAKLLAGVRVEDWASEPGVVSAKLAAVNDNGKPASGVAISAIVLTRKYYTYRKRLIGGFYAYENTEEVKRVGPLCSGTTDIRGLYTCQAKPGLTGEAIVQVSVTDDSGHTSVANTSAYIEGSRMWFSGQEDDRMDVLAEKPEYQPGDTARFQVRMPFSEATALVTVEREGILAATVLRLSTSKPVVTLPVRDYAPNVFVSVLAVRGRIAGIQPTAMVDLGKPAFKLGISSIRVGWRDHQLKVNVTPEKLVYHVRDKAHVKVAVRNFDGSAPPAGSTIAIAAVDEGLLELMPNTSWKLLEAMMDQRPYQVDTSTAEMQVVGRRHYGLKAIPPGGGGGRAITRELFDTLLLWKATVALDANGDADVEVPLNDSLTSFKIVAIAAGGTGQFGTGESSIRSTQDLQLFSGVSPIARNGDSFAAEFTVRNASDGPLDVNVAAAVEGLAAKPAPQKITLGPGDGKTIDWHVAVPFGPSTLKYKVDALAASGPQDHLLISQQIIPAVPVRTWQATLTQLDKPISQPVAVPSDAVPNQGGVDVRLSPTLTAGLGSIEAWMRAYPYICLEQRVSRAIALHDAEMWKNIIADLPSYTDGDGLLKYFPTMQEGSDVLTSYVLAIASEAGLMIPGDVLSSSQSGLSNFVAGKLARQEPFAVVDLPLRKLAAIEALSRYGKADSSLLSSVHIEPNLWPDSAVIDWWSILERTQGIPKRAERLDEAERIMRARLNEQGTAMHLSSDPRNDLWWLMVSPADNMVRMMLVALDAKTWSDDLPKIMRGALAMQDKGSWQGTVTNAWGTLAINKFAQVFESTPVAGMTTASLGTVSNKLDWAHDPKGGTLDFPWPPALANLDITHAGSGSPWVEIRTSAAIPLKAPFTSGFTITKTIKPVDSTHAGGWKQGDLARVHLKIDAQTDMTWVVIDDPIPAGASHLGIGLARESQIATATENLNNENYLWPDYTERAFSGFRAYYSYVPKGTFEIEYTIRLNQIGTFQLPPTHVGALYEPEMLGELPNNPFTVGQ
ncbi:MAG TPA: MG2 domain-containing protein [Candidatus Binataceae bacterium]|nr:MG2 domain-containing protein [Candidatus Binataceae bacterium]